MGRLLADRILSLSVLFFVAGCVMMTWAVCQQRPLVESHPFFSETNFKPQVADNSAVSEWYRSVDGEDVLGEFDIMRFEQDQSTNSDAAAPRVLPNRQGRRVIVEHAIAGHSVEFSEAMRSGKSYSMLEDLNYEALEQTENEHASGIVLFIGVTSACCGEQHRKRREAIRETWMQDALDLYDNVAIKFLVGQPSSGSCGVREDEKLSEEIRQHGDIVFVRADDSYDGLTNKTLGMLKYFLSAPERFTHILKTDDDTYVRVSKLLKTLKGPDEESLMTGVYKGLLENPDGYRISRNPASKWYFSYQEFDRKAAAEIDGTVYLAGWGYLVSRDLVFHAMKKVYAWDRGLRRAPSWHNKLKMLEDVMVGALLSDVIQLPDSDPRFRAAWQGCRADTAVVHLDVDSPRLLRGLYEQEVSGLWERKSVVCSSGNFGMGDYFQWRDWRNARLAEDLRI